MKKKILLASCILIALLVPLSLYAIDLGGGLADKAAEGAGYAKTTDTSLAETIGVVIKTALSFVGTIFLILTVYAGFLWMLARGDDGQIEKAHKIIQNAVIGLVITVGAYSITAFVVPRIVSKTAGDQSAPRENTCQQLLDRCKSECRSDNDEEIDIDICIVENCEEAC
jgi:hypothetical protein